MSTSKHGIGKRIARILVRGKNGTHFRNQTVGTAPGTGGRGNSEPEVRLDLNVLMNDVFLPAPGTEPQRPARPNAGPAVQLDVNLLMSDVFAGPPPSTKRDSA